MQDMVLQDANYKIDYQRFLEDASRSMIRFKHPQHLIKMIIKTIDTQVKTAHTAALLYREDKKYFTLIESKGVGGKKIPVGYVRLNMDNPLISVFLDEKNSLFDEYGALTYDNLEIILETKGLREEDPVIYNRINTIKEELDLYEVQVCIPSYFKKKLLGVLMLGRKLDGQRFKKEEIGFFTTLANDVAMALANAQLIESLQEKIKEIAVLVAKEHKLFVQTTVALSTAIDARDQYTHGHTERVTTYAVCITEELMNLPQILNDTDFKDKLYIAALLHDIGKIGVPDAILNKKDPLTNDEFAIIKKHSKIGASILTPIEELDNIIKLILYHHEKYDGTGYPEGLKADEIPLGAQIIAVADTFDAIITDRPYRAKRSIPQAIEEIKRCCGTQFNPVIVDAFLRAYSKGRIVQYLQ